MSDKKPMPLGELEALIKKGLCAYDEATRLEAQARLLEEGSEMVAQQLAHKSNSFASPPDTDFMIETLMQLPLTVKLGALLFIARTKPNGNTHFYQEAGKKALREAIKIFKENKDTKNLLRIKKSFVTQDILELAFQSLEELGESPPPLRPELRPTLWVDSLQEVTIEDDWIRCNVTYSQATKEFSAHFWAKEGLIQSVKIKNKRKTVGKKEPIDKKERDYIMSQGFKQTGERKDSEFIYYRYTRSAIN